MTRRQLTLLLLLAALWGGSYALIKVLLDAGLPWGWIAPLRVGLGALVVTAVAARAVGLRALAHRPGSTLAVGAAQVGVPLSLIAWGELEVPSGLAGILVATSPLLTALISARVVPDARLDRRGVLGVVVGFAGILLLFAGDLAGSGDRLVAGLAIVAAALGYAIGSTTARRRLHAMEPVAVSAATLLWATLVAAVGIPLAGGGPPTGLLAPGPVLAVLVLGPLGTGIAFLIFFTLVAQVGPSRTMFVTYLAPVFALVYGTTLLGEPLTAAAIGGIVLVVGGSLLGSGVVRRRGRGPDAPTSERLAASAAGPTAPG